MGISSHASSPLPRGICWLLWVRVGGWLVSLLGVSVCVFNHLKAELNTSMQGHLQQMTNSYSITSKNYVQQRSAFGFLSVGWEVFRFLLMNCRTFSFNHCITPIGYGGCRFVSSLPYPMDVDPCCTVAIKKQGRA